MRHMSEFYSSQDLKHDILGGVLQSKHEKHVHFTSTATKRLTHDSKIETTSITTVQLNSPFI